MDPTPDELPPGCLVLLLRLSAGMTADVVTSRGESVAFASARMLADELVEWLATNASGHPFEVAVLGYRAGEDGTPRLFSLLPDGDAAPRLVPLAQVAEMPAVPREAEGQPRKWAVLPECAGEPCATAALASVYQLVSVWLTGRYTARPPVVIHCTGTDGLDEAYFRVARSLGLLATAYGPARLMHYAFESGADPIPAGTWTEAPDGAPWADLFGTSGELPPDPASDMPARRAIAVNDWHVFDQWSALFTYTWREDTTAWVGSGGLAHSREMWAQKMGNSPDQWEDAYAVDAPAGAAVIADGASSGIYCSIWARQLSSRFLTDRPDTRDPIFLNKWVNGLRREWRTAIDYSNLNWSKQAKVDQVGAAATFLALEVGPARASGERPWRACAIGDASLFWIRDGRVVATFPVVAADQFGSAPLLVRSNPGFRTVALAAEGTCRPADRFVLATDAVAARLFKSTASGPGPEWSRFETIDQTEWRAELDTLRKANDMVNDDCTLVVLRIGSAVAEVAEADADATSKEHEPVGDANLPLAPEAAEPTTEGTSAGASEKGEHSPDSPQEAIAADVGDLMLDIPHDPPGANAQKDVQAPHSPERIEPPPAVEPPAARDGFPEPTDPRV